MLRLEKKKIARKCDPTFWTTVCVCEREREWTSETIHPYVLTKVVLDCTFALPNLSSATSFNLFCISAG